LIEWVDAMPMTSDHLSAESILHEYYMKEGGARGEVQGTRGRGCRAIFDCTELALSGRSTLCRVWDGGPQLAGSSRQ
jgi:hypothetical protein